MFGANHLGKNFKVGVHKSERNYSQAEELPDLYL